MVLNKKEIKEFYPIIFKVKQTEYCALWYTDEMDGFLLDNDRKIRLFLNVTDAKVFADKKDYSVDSEILILSDDIYKELDMKILDCNLILTYWNILSDMAKSINYDFLGDSKVEKIQKVYDKLFYGCNFPSINKSGENFFPKWEEDEKSLIKMVLKNGFDILQKNID